MGGKAENVLLLLLRDAFFELWRIHDSVIDYVILDYFLLAGYKRIPAITKQIDNLPNNNPGVFDMYKVLNMPYSEILYRKLTINTNLHKLTYKMDFVKVTFEGKMTLYGYLWEQVYGEK